MSQKTHKMIRKLAKTVDGKINPARVKAIKKEFLAFNKNERAQARKTIKKYYFKEGEQNVG